jgi:manganese/iron transport system substrate-binding protein
MRKPMLFSTLLLTLALLCGCGSMHPTLRSNSSQLPQVVATTGIIADLAGQIAGDNAQVHTLLPEGADPHSYQPTPAAARLLADADLVLVHGAGLDVWVDPLLSATTNSADICLVTQGLTALQSDEDGVDPHFWLDPNLVITYVRNIASALTAIDPEHSDAYQTRAEQQIQELTQLHNWILATVADLPIAQRNLVTNHDSFRYFAARYDFNIVGTVIPGFHVEAEPSAQQLAALSQVVHSKKVKAIFTETTVNPRLAEMISTQAGQPIKILRLYTGSLSKEGGEADSYIKMIRYNVKTIVDGLL